jgi:hypothetical protein
MLATQTSDGDLRVWSVAKPPTSEPPRIIRVLKRADTFGPGPNWMAWSKNGRIIQYSEKYATQLSSSRYSAVLRATC